jgi:hypothetical protein
LFSITVFVTLAFPTVVQGHSGGTDQYGCHAGSQPYHCHNGGTGSGLPDCNSDMPWRHEPSENLRWENWP